jgi:hypothetical protein
LKSTPSQSAVTPLIVRLPPIVLFLIAQGMSPPPPVRVTFLSTVMPFSRTVSAPVLVTLPWTVMVECPSGSTLHAWAELPVYDGGWHPRARIDPAAAVTLRPQN